MRFHVIKSRINSEKHFTQLSKHNDCSAGIKSNVNPKINNDRCQGDWTFSLSTAQFKSRSPTIVDREREMADDLEGAKLTAERLLLLDFSINVFVVAACFSIYLQDGKARD